ncbi:unnamed protein product, partial [Polarella glacialis]
DLKCAKGQVGPQSGIIADQQKGDQVLGTYVGQVKSFNVQKGFGFIQCQDLKQEGWSGDVYLHKKHAEHTPFNV